MFTKMYVRMLALAEDDAGDVPGWVLITLMTAALVIVIWALAGPMLEQMISDALNGVQTEIKP